MSISYVYFSSVTLYSQILLVGGGKMAANTELILKELVHGHSANFLFSLTLTDLFLFIYFFLLALFPPWWLCFHVKSDL